MITGCHRDISVAGVWDGEEGLPQCGTGNAECGMKEF